MAKAMALPHGAFFCTVFALGMGGKFDKSQSFVMMENRT